MSEDLVKRLQFARSYLANHPTHGSWEHAHSVEDSMAEIESLTAERDALRQDAERYRWLRMKEVRVYQDREPYGCIMAASELALDGAIDGKLREGK
jgi:hypothetical protein